MSKTNWIYGKHACIHKLKNKPEEVIEVLISSNAMKDHACAAAVRGFNIDVRANEEISRVVGKSAVHQGIAIRVKRAAALTLNEVLDELESKSASVVLLLDQITDPQNVGSIIRSAAAFGCDAVITTKDNSAINSPVVAKAAVGTMDKVNICEVANLSDAIKRLKEIGFWVFGLDGSQDNDISMLNGYDKKALVLGAEGAGMRRLIKENCDLLLKIPMSNEVESLNVSNAAAIALYVAKGEGR